MLLFGTVGGFSDCQASVAAQFATLMRASGVVCHMPLCEPVLSDPAARLEVLRTQFNPKLIPAKRMLICNLRFPDEIKWLESFGGYVVHIDGRPSDTIAMREHHFYTTSDHRPRGRFDTVEQTYQAMMLRYQNHAKRLA